MAGAAGSATTVKVFAVLHGPAPAMFLPRTCQEYVPAAKAMGEASVHWVAPAGSTVALALFTLRTAVPCAFLATRS